MFLELVSLLQLAIVFEHAEVLHLDSLLGEEELVFCVDFGLEGDLLLELDEPRLDRRTTFCLRRSPRTDGHLRRLLQRSPCNLNSNY